MPRSVRGAIVTRLLNAPPGGPRPKSGPTQLRKLAKSQKPPRKKVKEKEQTSSKDEPPPNEPGTSSEAQAPSQRLPEEDEEDE